MFDAHDMHYYIAKETDWDPEKFIVVINYVRSEPVSLWKNGARDSIANRKIFSVDKDSFYKFRDESIKILQMDSYKTKDEAKESFVSWLSKMDVCGLMIFPGIHEKETGSSEFFHSLKDEGMRCAELVDESGMGFVMLGDENLWIEMLRKRPDPERYPIIF